MDPEEYTAYRESFEAFDWNNNGRISYTSLQVFQDKLRITRDITGYPTHHYRYFRINYASLEILQDIQHITTVITG